MDTLAKGAIRPLWEWRFLQGSDGLYRANRDPTLYQDPSRIECASTLGRPWDRPSPRI
jgi:hypothetical protein